MRTQRRQDQTGETLLEIVIAIVLIGLIASSLFYAFSTSASRSTTQQDLVTADGVLRDYAESVKAAVRNTNVGCGKPNPTTYTAPYTPTDARFTVSSSPDDLSQPQSCPPVTSVRAETLTVTMPNGEGSKTLAIDLRTP
jgi:type II secretory pathway pseudopilin PulG